MPRPMMYLSLLLAACAGGGDLQKSSTPTEPGIGDSEDTGPGDDIGADGPDWCAGTTAHRWDIDGAEDVEFFPDPILVTEASDSPTGYRLQLDASNTPWISGVPPVLSDGFDAFNTLSGFGTLGGVLLQFDRGVDGVPLTAADSLTDPGWQLLDLSGATPERVPYLAEVLEDGKTVILWPARPLRRGAMHAVLVTTDATDASGGCIAPAPATRALLHGEPTDDRIAPVAQRHRDALLSLGLEAAQVSAMAVFPTHDDIGDIQALAEETLATSPAWEGPGACVDNGDLIDCELALELLDYRDEDGTVDQTREPVTGVAPVSVWLPTTGAGPFPVVIYGHGLGSTRSEGRRVAEAIAESGVAVFAMEATEHGDHPQIDTDGSGEAALRFLGIDLISVTIRPRVIRGNLDQTTLDRLRLIQAIKANPDLDGDGTPDVDTDAIGYIGISLGSILGPGLLSLSPDIIGAVFSVGGARLISVAADTDQLSDFEEILDALVGSAERFDRLVAVAQHVVDPSDPGTWAPHVLHDRLDGRTPPHLLVQSGMADEVMPPSTGFAMARALGIPHMAPVAEPVELIDVTSDDPVVGNLAEGATTAAYFQFDRVTRDGGLRDATHIDTAVSDEAVLQMTHFLDTWLATGVPEILEPYAALGTPEAR